MEHKFRTPVKCQNGHKAFWYWKHSDRHFLQIETIQKPPDNTCGCSKFSIGEGWERDGDDQMFIGLHSDTEIEIFDQDLVKIFNSEIPYVVEFHNGAFGYWVDKGRPWTFFVSFCQNTNFTNSGTRINEIEIIGSTHLTPELIPNG